VIVTTARGDVYAGGGPFLVSVDAYPSTKRSRIERFRNPSKETKDLPYEVGYESSAIPNEGFF